MKTLMFALGILLAFAFVGLFDVRAERDAAKAREEIALARYAEAVTDVQVRIDTVKKWLPRWDTVYRDTGSRLTDRITDTVWVKEALTTADTTIRACTALLTSCERYRVAAESLIAAKDARIEALKPTWRDRCGVQLGVGAVRVDGAVRVGPALNAGCKLWP